MNYHKPVGVGGELGQQLELLWEAVRANQIKPSPGQRINRTPSGTTISFTGKEVSATVQGSATATHGIFLHDPNYSGSTPREDGNGSTPFQQLAMWFRVGTVEQLVLLPPSPGLINPGQGHTSQDHWYFSGQYWPHTLRPSAGARGYYFQKELHKNDHYAIQKFDQPLPVNYLTQFGKDTTVIASQSGGGSAGTIDPNNTIKYFMTPLGVVSSSPSNLTDWEWDAGP